MIFGFKYDFFRVRLITVLALCLCFGCSNSLLSQEPYWKKFDLESKEYPSPNNEAELQQLIQSLILENRINGLPSYSIDSILIEENQVIIKSFAGNELKVQPIIQVLSSPNEDDSLHDIPTHFETFNNELIDQENSGHPFARYNFIESLIADSVLYLKYAFDPGPTVLIDSILIKSDDKINLKLIEKLTGLERKSLYNEELIRSIEGQISNIPYLKTTNNPQVVFREKGAHVYLFVDKKPANIFNGILGVQPDNITGQLRFTGDLQIKLSNAFNQGGTSYFNWKKIQSLTQELDLGFEFPFLAYSNFGVNGRFNLYKQDTSFVNTNSELGFGYSLDRNKSIEFFIRNESDNNLTSLNTLSNLKVLYYGIKLQWNKLDNSVSPKRGVSLKLIGSAGTKTIQNSSLEIEMEDLNTQYNIGSKIDFYLSINPKHGIVFSQKGESIFGNKLFENELIRLGGFHSIRGFDQNSLLASSYIQGSLQYRFYLDASSYLHLFYDQMWYESNSTSQYSRDTPSGFGTGINFQTANGIFSFNYALGKTKDSPILIRNGKIHFGYVNYF